MFRLEQGVAQGCCLSPILFSVEEVEQADLSLVVVRRLEECYLLIIL